MIYTCVKFELIVNMYSVALTGFFVYFLFRADEFSSAIIVRFEKAGTWRTKREYSNWLSDCECTG